METFFTTMHHIDLTSASVTFKKIQAEDAQKYISDLTDEVLLNPNKKHFSIRRDGTEVVRVVRSSFIKKILPDEERDTVAKRLLDIETKTQEKISKLGKKIKKGSLIQSLFCDSEFTYFVIAKIDSNRFLDEDDLVSREGLIFENKSLKTCVFKFNEQNEIEEVIVSDNNKKISDYWYNLFLELEPMTTDEENTKASFTVLSNSLKSSLEKKYPADYILCRNNLLSFYKTQPTFRLQDVVESLFNDYTPESEELDIDKVKGNFARSYYRRFKDTEFSIKSKAINKKKWQETKTVNQFVDITLNGSSDQIKNNISAEEVDGEKFIKIKSTEEKTFESFRW